MPCRKLLEAEDLAATRTCLLEFLVSRYDALETYLRSALVHALCLVEKRQWVDAICMRDAHGAAALAQLQAEFFGQVEAWMAEGEGSAEELASRMLLGLCEQFSLTQACADIGVRPLPR